jgi:hypothetical protein
MYNVSENFKNAVKSTSRKSTIYGTLTTVDGIEYQLNDSTFIKDSLYITNQIVNNNKLTFGAVYAGECGMIINSNIDRYSLFGAEIALNFALNDEVLPLGVFYVDTPERIGSKIKLTAVDRMSNFDMKIDEDVNGYWYELISYISEKCGVELAQTQAEFEALHPNATKQYTIQQEKIDTYRDAISYMAMIICANATIDNVGRLKFVQFATEACDYNDSTSRLNNCKFSDYTSMYKGVTARFFKEDNFYPYTAVNEEISGIVVDLGDIPIVGGVNDFKNEVIQAMCDTITQIAYVPSTLYIASNPAYELGDMIECKNVNNSSAVVNVYVMSYKYDYRKKETINCYGDNPLLQNIKSKEQKNNSAIESKIASKDMTIVNATNVSNITIGQKIDDVVTLNYSVRTDCKPICIFTIPFSIDVDGYVEFSLYNNMVLLENATYKGYYEKGEHFASFMYLDDMKADERHSINVMVKCYADTTSATRTQDARLKAIENGWSLIVAGEPAGLTPVNADTTEPTVTIAELAIKAIAYTQGINGGSTWDGLLNFSDTFGFINLTSVGIVPFSSDVDISTQAPTMAGIADEISNIAVAQVGIFAFSERVDFVEVILDYIFNTSKADVYEYNQKYVDATDAFRLKTEIRHTLVEESIDNGYMSVIEIDIREYSNVESVVVTGG